MRIAGRAEGRAGARGGVVIALDERRPRCGCGVVSARGRRQHMPKASRNRRVASGFVLFFALSLLAVPAITPALAATSHTTSLGAHGASRWTLGRSVYVNLKAMVPGTWKQQLWSGTCALPRVRLAVLPSLVVPNTRVLAQTTKTTVVPATDSGVVLRLLHGRTTLCGAFVEPVTPTPTPTATPTPTPIPTPTQAANVLLDVTGYGVETTNSFDAPADWEIDWSYDNCFLGLASNFFVSIYLNGQPTYGVRAVGLSGSGVEYVLDSAAKAYLDIQSGCHWTVLVVPDE